jgi:hypothetical protein
MNNHTIKKLGLKTGLYICSSFILLFLLVLTFNCKYNITLASVCFLLLFFWIYIAVYSYRLNAESEFKLIHGVALGCLSSGTGLTLFGTFLVLFSYGIGTEFLTRNVGNVGLTTALLCVISFGMLAGCLFSLFLMQFKKRVN